jgi:RNA binding exosome subunit
MGVHNISWSARRSAHASGQVIEDALSWLAGDDAEITTEMTRSYHGARILMIRASVKRKKAALTSIANLGENLLNSLTEDSGLSSRIDDDNALHLRLDLASLVKGEIRLAEAVGTEVVKGRIKLEVYPGQKPLEIAIETLAECARIADKNGLPSDPVAK